MKAKVLIPTGALGITYCKKTLNKSLREKPNIIVVDGGSTDSGPAYLGKGKSKYSRSTTKSEWKTLMIAREKLKIPLLIGSAGTCGTDGTVDWFVEITKELAKELNQKIKIVVLKCSQSNKKINKAFLKKKLFPLNNAPKISSKKILNCTNIVGLAGVEQITEALNTKADIIICGRSTDASLIASLPILKGVEKGIAWHGGKIGECGAFCTTNPKSGVILISFKKNGFYIKPISNDTKATPYTVSAHMVYENSNPFTLIEPGGYLNVRKASYKQQRDGSVYVTGSKWFKDSKYKVKLEGTYVVGYQNISLVLIREKSYVDDIEKWTKQIENKTKKIIKNTLLLKNKTYEIQFRFIGKNATLGSLENSKVKPDEIGVLAIVTTINKKDSEEISKILNPLLLHHSLYSNGELPTFAFPFSPPSFNIGKKYEFCLNHVIEIKDPMDIFKLEKISL
mgnify:FL=1